MFTTRLTAITLATLIAGLVLFAMIVASPGCAALRPKPVAAGEDPVLVNAQRSIRAAFTVTDEFLAAEDESREQIRTTLPAVHAFAEDLRRSGPQKFREAWAAVDAYQIATTTAKETAGDDLNAKLATVQNLAAQARKFLATLAARKPPATRAA